MLYGRLPTTRRLSSQRREVERERVGDVQRAGAPAGNRRRVARRGRGRSRWPSMCPARSISAARQRGQSRADLDHVVAAARGDRRDDLARCNADRRGSSGRSACARRGPDASRARSSSVVLSGRGGRDRVRGRPPRTGCRGRRAARRRRRRRGRARCRDRPTCGRYGRPSVTLTPWPKLAALSAGRPWSWYIATIASKPLRDRRHEHGVRRNAVRSRRCRQRARRRSPAR